MSQSDTNGLNRHKWPFISIRKWSKLLLLNQRFFLLILFHLIIWITGVSSIPKPSQSYSYYMKIEKQRVCIYPKDIQCITGKSYRQSTRLMQKVKSDLNKLENEFLTIEEFCLYAGLKYEQVTHLIFGWKGKN